MAEFDIVLRGVQIVDSTNRLDVVMNVTIAEGNAAVVESGIDAR